MRKFLRVNSPTFLLKIILQLFLSLDGKYMEKDMQNEEQSINHLSLLGLNIRKYH
jgi:hypothetical protein